jgi:hypothetical protein
VLAVGAEYGSGHDTAEVYDPAANTWTLISTPSGNDFSDSVLETYPNGNVLVNNGGGVNALYNWTTNTWSSGPTASGGNGFGECAWVKLPPPSNGIMSMNGGTNSGQHYSVAQNKWVGDGATPAAMWASNSEIGPGILLPNGKVMMFGGTGNNCQYTPAANDANAGTWTASAVMPGGNGMCDAPCAIEPCGIVLVCTGPAQTYNSPSTFYEYNYVNNSFTQPSQPGIPSGTPPFECEMLVLPDGGILLNDGSAALREYMPSGAPLAAGQPTVQSYLLNSDGSYTLTGTLLNGISEGANYGDDAMSSTNFPIVRLTNSAGNVYYCRTYNWDTTNVMTGSTPQTTQFTLPSGLPSGSYALQVVANGNPSASVNFKTGGTSGSAFFEAEALTVNASSDTVSDIAEAAYSSGQGDILYANAVGDYVTYLVPNVSAGTYTVSVGVKESNLRGIFQLSGSRADQIYYTNIGSPIDEYNSGSGVFTEITVGTWSPTSTNDKLFNFAVTGKNASSSGDYLSVDYIRLTRQ